jgi:hypothetical protein
MTDRTSAQINAEIYNLGPALFEAVREAVLVQGTQAPSRAEHEANQAKLNAAVASVLDDARPKDLDHDGLWQVLWRRVVYAGTLAAKATREIASMRERIPLFQGLRHYAPSDYAFDAGEWKAFAQKWKDRLTSDWHKVAWIRLSKADPEWNPAADFSGAKTTPAVWKILTKDDALYPNLEFSSKGDKMQKYLDVADFLHRHQRAGHTQPLHEYTGGCEFSAQHVTGDAWLRERQMLERVRERFQKQVGMITALHVMMDLGLKTIKPDRVMTYLFSQLGWLQTLPDTLDKATVLDAYNNKEVVREMTARADVLAASLDRAGFAQAHRLLDIWLVKYGQEPEPEFGITVNLQDAQSPGIRALFDRLKAEAEVASPIADHEAGTLWPIGEFAPLAVDAAAKAQQKKPRTRRRAKVMSREEAERLFVQQWRIGFETRPEIYPAGRPGIANGPKEQILCKIERGTDPEEAFLSVLITDEDD